MEIAGKTSVIDSDFRSGAIFYSLTNVILFAFAITNTVIYSRLVVKSNKMEGVNILAMSIISGIVSVLAGGLFFYSIYKLVKVREMRDKIESDLQRSRPIEEPMMQEENKNIRNLNKPSSENTLSNIKTINFKPAKGRIPARGMF